MAKGKTAKREDEVAIGMGVGPYPLVPLPGARNIRTLSASFIADMQTQSTEPPAKHLSNISGGHA
jgi:hypothetical protein